MTTTKFNLSGKVLRNADMFEFGPATLTLAAGCTVDKLTPEQAFENLRAAFPVMLADFPELRLHFATVEGAPHWAFSQDSELEFDKLVQLFTEPDTSLPVALPLEERPLWRVHVFPDAGCAGVKVFVSHGFCDGRTLFDILTLFAFFAREGAAPKSPLPEAFAGRSMKGKEDRVLESLPLAKEDWFAPDVVSTLKGTPASWKRVVECALTPAVELPSHSVPTQWTFEYRPVVDFCKKHGVSIQGLAGAVEAHAMWTFSGSDVKEIAVFTPTDMRRSPFSAEAIKKGTFFAHAGFVLSFVPRRDTLLEEILGSAESLRAAVSTPEAAQVVLFQSGSPRAAEGEITPLPDCGRNNIVYASHIGRICGVEGLRNPSFAISNPVWGEKGYWPSLYVFHSNDVINFTFVHPHNVSENFVNAVRDAVKEAMDLAGAAQIN